jgi:hypothetical protein
VLLRAAQAGFFRHAYLLRLRLRPGALLEATGLRGGLDRHAARPAALAGHPRLAAADALALVPELPPERLGQLTLDQVSPTAAASRPPASSTPFPTTPTAWSAPCGGNDTSKAPRPPARLFTAQPGGPRLGPVAMQHLVATAANTAAPRLPIAAGRPARTGRGWTGAGLPSSR